MKIEGDLGARCAEIVQFKEVVQFSVDRVRVNVVFDCKTGQQSYDKRARWRGGTLVRKAVAVLEAKGAIGKPQERIEQLEGDFGARGADRGTNNIEFAALVDYSSKVEGCCIVSSVLLEPMHLS